MKKLIAVVAIVVFGALGINTAKAEDGFVIGARGGISNLTQDISETVTTGGDTALGINVGYKLNKYFTMGLDIDYEKHPTANIKHEVRTGEFRTLSIMHVTQLHLPINKYFQPYALGGLGININKFELDSVFDPVCDYENCDIDLSNDFGYKAGIGLDIFVTDHIALNFESLWKYNQGNAEISVSRFYNIYKWGGDFNATTIITTVGLKYYF